MWAYFGWFFWVQPLLLEHCGLFFVPLSLAVVNDDSARCKKMASLAIKSLLGQLDVKHQNSMFTLVNGWLTGEKVIFKTRWFEDSQADTNWIKIDHVLFSVYVCMYVQVALRRLGTQVCGIFVEVEGEQFGRRLDSLLPLIEREIHTANFEDVSIGARHNSS